jgi:ABC-type transport system substrate-binding protein
MRRAVNYAIDRRRFARVGGDRPTDQQIPPGWPGFRDATIYPLGGPDLVTARRLAGSGPRRGVLYTCNFPECLERAEIVRENLAAIGIELEVRRFSMGEMFARVRKPDEPFDLSLFGWYGDLPDPSYFIDDMLAYHTSTGFLKRTPLGRRIRAASRLAGAARTEAYAALDRDIAAQAAPFVPIASGLKTHFFSARIGCQTENPVYGIDLAALCVRN